MFIFSSNGHNTYDSYLFVTFQTTNKISDSGNVVTSALKAFAFYNINENELYCHLMTAEALHSQKEKSDNEI